MPGGRIPLIILDLGVIFSHFSDLILDCVSALVFVRSSWLFLCDFSKGQEERNGNSAGGGSSPRRGEQKPIQGALNQFVSVVIYLVIYFCYSYVLMLCAIHMCSIMCKKLCANEVIPTKYSSSHGVSRKLSLPPSDSKWNFHGIIGVSAHDCTRLFRPNIARTTECPASSRCHRPIANGISTGFWACLRMTTRGYSDQI